MRSDVKRLVNTWWADLGVMLCLAMATVLCSLALPDRAVAATIAVNSVEDTVVSGDGACTLREAILNAERDSHAGSTDCAAGSGGDTITFNLTGTINLDSNLGILRVDSAGGLTIDGGGRITITCPGGNAEPCYPAVLSVGSLGVLTLKNLTVANGRRVISNDGIMTVSNSTVSDSSYFGAIHNNGTMTISHSWVSNNKFITGRTGGGPSGSGIDNHGILTMSNSTVSGNQVEALHDETWGGAIFNAREGILTITDSTVARNESGIRFIVLASGIYNEGTLTISSSTVSDNASPCDSPDCNTTGIFNSGTLKLHSSLIADGCVGPIISLGYNLDKTGTCGLTGPGDQSNIDPRLDPAGLKDNGGPTQTLALCTGSGTPTGCTGKSPAIDAVPLAHCTGAGGQPQGLDQRVFFRPADGDRNGTVLCDMGAFETTSSPLQTLNSLATFTPLPATYQTSRDTTGCPAGYVGKFRFNADLTNKAGSPPVKHVIAEVATLTKGNLVLNADGGLGGDGATVTFAPNGDYTDSVLSTKEHVTLPFALCLKTFDRFTFFVDVLGTR